MIKVTPQAIAEVLLIEPQVFGDARGFFLESYHQAQFDAAVGRPVHFKQDNHSRSTRHVLRGLHYQVQQPQGKLLRVVEGELFDVAVDLRKSSASYGKWVGVVLSAANQRQLWVPEGFAHGFIVLSEYASCLYKATDFYAPEYERCLRWDDPSVGIVWPAGPPILSAKDQCGLTLDKTEGFA
jgi:dTDP-4-dehydrorhamnose 3,5-epimerase